MKTGKEESLTSHNKKKTKSIVHEILTSKANLLLPMLINIQKLVG